VDLVREKGILYGVGVGPGDPELLTVKAVRILNEVDTIAAPDAGSGESVALNILGELTRGKEILLCPAPMKRDKAALDALWDQSAEGIRTRLEEGRSVAFVTLGDPSIYSTFTHLQRRLLGWGYEVETVPGVPSFCAAAAALNRPLCQGEEGLTILSGASSALEEGLNLPGTRVVMKAGRRLDTLRVELERRGELERARVVENCGMEGQRLAPLEELERSGYFSMVLVEAERFPGRGEAQLHWPGEGPGPHDSGT
jgi:precorrin-2/cobalt-factor-2 C20-methyltransferase